MMLTGYVRYAEKSWAPQPPKQAWDLLPENTLLHVYGSGPEAEGQAFKSSTPKSAAF